jgi:hypothetical protein
MRRMVRLSALRLQGERQAVEREQKSDSGPKTLLEYAQRYRRIDQQPFDLTYYEPLRALYEDESPTIAVMKPSQRGVSEYAITKALFVLDRGAKAYELPKAGLNVGYIFPTDVALRDFSKERVAGIKDEHEHLRRLLSTSAYDGIGFKQIGSSYLYMRGGTSESGLLSFTADMIIRDEYDKIPRNSRELAEKRMNASLFRRLLDISTPTLPGMGIHERFMASDQHIYMQECPNCHEENQYDFFRDVTVDGERYDIWQYWDEQRIRRCDVALTCPHCGIDLDKKARCRAGRYVPQFPDVQGLRGYHIPSMAFPFVNLMDLAVKAINSDPSAKEQFMRQDLGVPYHTKGGGITEEDLVPLSLGLPNGQLPPGPYTRVTMGVDVGGRLHCRINGMKPGEKKRYVLQMTSVATWAEVDNLMETYNVQMCVLDAYPEQHEASAFVQRWKGRAVIGDYPHNMGALKGTLYAPEAKKAVQDGFVRINRTMAADRVMTSIHGQREHWPTRFINDSEVRSHMTAMARVTTIDKSGQVVASWIRLRADHFYHASIYAEIAAELTPKLIRPGHVIQASAKTQMPSGTNYMPQQNPR